jgi:hypothetical protein
VNAIAHISEHEFLECHRLELHLLFYLFLRRQTELLWPSQVEQV